MYLKTKGQFVAAMIVIFVIITFLLFLPTLQEQCACSYQSLTTTIKIIQLLAIVGIIKDGTTIRTIHFRFIQIGAALYIVGLMFKVMHWPFAMEIGAVALSLGMFSYVVGFMNKKSKTKLDVLKVCWVIAFASSSFVVLNHLMKREVVIVSELLAWFLILFYLLDEYKKWELENKNQV